MVFHLNRRLFRCDSIAFAIQPAERHAQRFAVPAELLRQGLKDALRPADGVQAIAEHEGDTVRRRRGGFRQAAPQPPECGRQRGMVLRQGAEHGAHGGVCCSARNVRAAALFPSTGRFRTADIGEALAVCRAAVLGIHRSAASALQQACEQGGRLVLRTRRAAVRPPEPLLHGGPL